MLYADSLGCSIMLCEDDHQHKDSKGAPPQTVTFLRKLIKDDHMKSNRKISAKLPQITNQQLRNLIR